MNSITKLFLLFVAIIFITGCSYGKSDQDKRKEELEQFSALSAYVIDQVDKRKGTIKLPGSFPGTNGYLNFTSDIVVITTGEIKAKDKSLSYLEKWEVKYNYDEKWQELTIDSGNNFMGKCKFTRNNIKISATLNFDLSKANKQDHTFDVKISNIKTGTGAMTMKCKSGPAVSVPTMNQDQNITAVTKGKIKTLGYNSAILEFPKSFVFNSYNFSDNYYRKLDKPIVLKIKMIDT